jgi:superfamily II helicase
MSSLEEFSKRRDYGLPVMEALMQMGDSEIRKKVRSICGDKIPDADLILGPSSGVVRTIRSEKPDKIEIAYYDVITITPYGISFKPEHGDRRELVAFGPHFVL